MLGLYNISGTWNYVKESASDVFVLLLFRCLRFKVLSDFT